MTLSQDPPTVTKPSRSTSAKVDPTKGSLTKQKQIYLSGTDCLLRPQVSLADLTSFRVGGPAEWYATPQDLTELQACLEWARGAGLPVTFLGAGSNLLISDRGLPGLVISTRHLRHTEFHEDQARVTVGSGKPMVRLCWQVAERGWQGLEWAIGIPGTVGGAVVMNAGAHGESTADVLVNAEVLLPNGNLLVLTPEELNYGYRTSILQHRDWIVTQATFQLKPGADPAQVEATTLAHQKLRHSTQPYHLPSCGSVFRNPGPQASGWLIEQTGLKGYQLGGAQVSELHANFILNCGNATAMDIYRLIHYVQQKVEQHSNIRLEPEVKILGEF